MKRFFLFFLSSLLAFGVDPAFRVCSSGDNGGGASTTATTSVFSSTAGDAAYIFVFFRNDCGSITLTITNVGTDTPININSGLTGAASVANGGLFGGADMVTCTGQFYVKNMNGSAIDAFLVTASTSVDDLSIAVLEISGASTTAPLDASTTTGYTGATGATVTTPNWTTSSIPPNQIEVAGAASYAINRMWTADTGWTMDAACTPTGVADVAVQYKTVTSTQTGVNVTFTLSGANSFLQAMAATFAGAASATYHGPNGGVFVTGP